MVSVPEISPFIMPCKHKDINDNVCASCNRACLFNLMYNFSRFYVHEQRNLAMPKITSDSLTVALTNRGTHSPSC